MHLAGPKVAGANQCRASQLLFKATPLGMLAAGVAIGIYLRPIRRAPPPLATADIQAATSAETFKGRFARNQKGNEFLHRGEGEI